MSNFHISTAFPVHKLEKSGYSLKSPNSARELVLIDNFCRQKGYRLATKKAKPYERIHEIFYKKPVTQRADGYHLETFICIFG